jgi:hypothetical protein
MKVIAYDNGGEIQFHKVGCNDLNKPANRLAARNAEIFSNLDAAVAEYLDTGDETNPGWIIEEMRFFPCLDKKETR